VPSASGVVVCVCVCVCVDTERFLRQREMTGRSSPVTDEKRARAPLPLPHLSVFDPLHLPQPLLFRASPGRVVSGSARCWR